MLVWWWLTFTFLQQQQHSKDPHEKRLRTCSGTWPSEIRRAPFYNSWESYWPVCSGLLNLIYSASLILGRHSTEKPGFLLLKREKTQKKKIISGEVSVQVTNLTSPKPSQSSVHGLSPFEDHKTKRRLWVTHGWGWLIQLAQESKGGCQWSTGD